MNITTMDVQIGVFICKEKDISRAFYASGAVRERLFSAMQSEVAKCGSNSVRSNSNNANSNDNSASQVRQMCEAQKQTCLASCGDRIGAFTSQGIASGEYARIGKCETSCSSIGCN